MKKIYYMVLPLSVFLASCTPIIYTSTDSGQTGYPDQQAYADPQQTDQVFYDELSPYGQWIDYPEYGYVWQPNVDPDFRPYETNGQWAYSEYGWTWVSNYSWGWAPFHYGNWFFDGNYGWMWAPGNQWAPAWVTWSQSGDYYGWAPVPPRQSYNSGWRPRDNDWNFVNARNINRGYVHNYVVRNSNVARNVSYINNENVSGGRYNRGPRVNDVETRTNSRITPVRVSGSTRPGHSFTKDQLVIYRPTINQNTNTGNNRPAPRNPENYRQGGNQRPDRNQNRPNPNKNQPNNRPDRNQNRPGNNQNNQPAQQPVVTPPVNQPVQRPDNRPGRNQNRPGNNQNNQPVQQPGVTPPVNQPVQRPDNRPDRNQNRPADQPPIQQQRQQNQQPGQPVNPPVQRPENRPDRNQNRPADQPPVQQQRQQNQQPAQPVVQPSPRPIVQPAPRPVVIMNQPQPQQQPQPRPVRVAPPENKQPAPVTPPAPKPKDIPQN
ncbi:hypothetical protein BH09BAC6_BH09BAC6_04550 [soil metagenome]